MANQVGQELLNVPFPEMVLKLALAIAEGQTKLDQNSTAVAKFMADTKIPLPSIKDITKTIDFPLIAMGFFPGYYQFQEAIIEVKMAITMATSSEAKVGITAKGGWGPFSASVNASYSRKYEYKVEGSSLLRVRLVPVPPPSILQEYMEALMKKMSASLEAEKEETPATP
jgi:hypothetical protein